METTVPFGRSISVRQLPFAVLSDNVFWNRCMRLYGNRSLCDRLRSTICDPRSSAIVCDHMETSLNRYWIGQTRAGFSTEMEPFYFFWESFSLSLTALIFSVPNCSRSSKIVFDHPLPNMLNCIYAQQCSLVCKYRSEPSNWQQMSLCSSHLPTTN